ncbi:hypothetical protein [Pseudomonas sp.]|uniref:hypothetical protein n=1 Tax=Pseudomonas sp. TaxID=306 RepID=UPI0019F607F2|nr:hypothetical protein [Pseudomonas sp.]MBF0676550.1 hypothetical protein [Pseudomonas sp.]
MNISRALLGCCLLASFTLHAAPAFNPVELSDHELAQLRGRYVLPGHVVHFGITMTSAWENSGQRLDASVSLQAQQGMARPLITVTANGNGQGPAPAAGSGTIIGGQGLNNVDGISQSVRTAGDLNTARNDLSININRNGQAPALDRSGTPLNGEFSAHTNLGNATIQTTPNGGLQVSIQANGQGTSLQQLGGGGLRQSADIVSSNNKVHNLTHLDVVLQANRTSLDALNCNLDQLRGLRPIGY